MPRSDDPPTLPPWRWPRAAYVHVPFCAHHCGYCDFAIAVGRDELVPAYLDALALELSALRRPQPVSTIYVGGGTPTHLAAADLERLLTDLCHWLVLQPGGEFSIEANPESLDEAKVAILASHGVTRVSLGAQSFDPQLLQALDRRHRPEHVPQAIDRIRRRLREVSLDLIFAIPGQTPAQWRRDLEQALALPVDHLSTYGLTYEKGTPLWKERQRGQVRPLLEEAELALYALAIDTLEAAGFEHYEISNFARPGHRSRHNQVYWANEAYFGFGMGAARYVLGRRELNTRSLHRYLERLRAGQSPTLQSEELSPWERARETMAGGIDRLAFRRQTDHDLDRVAGTALRRHVELGLLCDNGQAVRLTRQGKYLADAVIERLLRGGAD
jgi:oxygen-independent coproporphyrinogen-3 oxidase